jgi:hypothetical protein
VRPEKLFKGLRNLPSIYESMLSQNEKNLCLRGLNFAVTNGVSNLDMVCAAESARFKLLRPRLGYGDLLEESSHLTSNTTRKGCMALKSLKDIKGIRIRQADKGTCTVMLNESTHKENISSLL